jgi:TetR/AcrR family transcriptional regulator, lmrAB and yxaGH operons repressor
MADVASARDRMVSSAVRLLARYGVTGTSFSSILQDSGAPRGSIYFHFPGGKDELLLAAVDRSWAETARIVESLRGQPAETVVSSFLAAWRETLTLSDFGAGCSLLGVTVSAEDPALVAHTAELFDAWERLLADIFRSAGITPARARELGTVLLSASEGAVVLCRARRSFEPLDRIERPMRALARQATEVLAAGRRRESAKSAATPVRRSRRRS